MDNKEKFIGKVLKKAGELLDKEPSEQTLLTEYQACQHDNSSSGTTYWAMSGIFISISSAILGGLLYTLFSNNELFKAVLNVSQNTEYSGIASVVKTVVAMISVIMFLILIMLRFWMKRVRYLQQINFDRMREIESDLGMWKSWRVHGLDHWNGNGFDETITKKDSERLLEYKKPKWWNYWKKRYAHRNRFYYDLIYAILLLAWLLPILVVFWPIALWAVILAIIVWGLLVQFAIKLSKVD